VNDLIQEVAEHGKTWQNRLDKVNAWHQVQHNACRYLQATAALIQQSGSSMQPKLLHLIAWLPAHRFGTFSMSLAVFAWHWIFAESPNLQVGNSVFVITKVIKVGRQASGVRTKPTNLANRHQVHAAEVSLFGGLSCLESSPSRQACSEHYR